jgi:transketolase
MDEIISNLKSLDQISSQIRLKVLEAAGTTGGGHLGGTFSCVDILVNLYNDKNFNLTPSSGNEINSDKFILSKGHACLAYYAILVMQKKLSQERFESFSKNGGLGAQLDVSVPFVHWNTGSLGHSIGISAGIAHASKINKTNVKAVTLIGDSELSEGASWEAIFYSGDHNLSNLIVIIDRNRLSVTSRIDEDSIYSELDNKITKSGWNYLEIDGHDHLQISKALENAISSSKPTLILANTIKGKGVSFMENNPIWHHTRPSHEQFENAINELNLRINGIK